MSRLSISETLKSGYPLVVLGISGLLIPIIAFKPCNLGGQPVGLIGVFVLQAPKFMLGDKLIAVGIKKAVFEGKIALDTHGCGFDGFLQAVQAVRVPFALGELIKQFPHIGSGGDFLFHGFKNNLENIHFLNSRCGAVWARAFHGTLVVTVIAVCAVNFQLHDLLTIRADQNALEQIVALIGTPFAEVYSVAVGVFLCDCLYSVPKLITHNSFMGVADDYPFGTAKLFLFAVNARSGVFMLCHMPCVNRIFDDGGNTCIRPVQPIGRRRFIPPHSDIALSWRRYAHLVELLRYSCETDTLCFPLINLLHGGGGIGVDNEPVVIVLGFQEAIRGRPTDKIAVVLLGGKHGLDFPRHILDVRC